MFSTNVNSWGEKYSYILHLAFKKIFFVFCTNEIFTLDNLCPESLEGKYQG